MARSDKKKYGSAVENGNLRYHSASSLSSFDPSQDGGCNRRWHFEKIQRKKPPQKAWQTKGVDVHLNLASYLSTGAMVLDSVSLAGKRFLPAPGKDLIIESGWGDFDAAIIRRDRVIAGKASSYDVGTLCLSILGVPVMGEMDLRHRRGEWVTDEGAIVREEDPEHTAEVFDHKTSSSLAWAKSGDELVQTIQMPLYAKATLFEWPDIEHVRLSHGVYSTSKREAKKTSKLIHLKTIEKRWSDIETIARAMTDVAREPDISKVEANTGSCSAFKGCAFLNECPLSPEQTTFTIFAHSTSTSTQKGNSAMSLFDMLSNEAPAAPAPPAPPAPKMPEVDYRSAVESEKARLMAEDGGSKKMQVGVVECVPGNVYLVDCEDGNPPVKMTFSYELSGAYYFVDGQGAKVRMRKGETVFLESKARCVNPACGAGCAPGWVKHGSGYVACSTCAKQSVPAAPVAPPAPPAIGAINPPDAPKQSMVDAADPIPDSEIANISDTEILARVTEHAKQHAERSVEQTASKPVKESGRCPGGNVPTEVTVAMAMKKKASCSVCGAERPIKLTEGMVTIPFPSHNRPKGTAEVASQAPPAPSAPPLPPEIPIAQLPMFETVEKLPYEAPTIVQVVNLESTIEASKGRVDSFENLQLDHLERQSTALEGIEDSLGGIEEALSKILIALETR